MLQSVNSLSTISKEKCCHYVKVHRTPKAIIKDDWPWFWHSILKCWPTLKSVHSQNLKKQQFLIQSVRKHNANYRQYIHGLRDAHGRDQRLTLLMFSMRTPPAPTVPWHYRWEHKSGHTGGKSDEPLNTPVLRWKLQQQQQASVKCFIFNKLSSTRMSPRFSVSHLRLVRCTGVQKSQGQTSAFINQPWKSYIFHPPCL